MRHVLYETESKSESGRERERARARERERERAGAYHVLHVMVLRGLREPLHAHAALGLHGGGDLSAQGGQASG